MKEPRTSKFASMINPDIRPTLSIRLKPMLQDYIRYITNLEEPRPPGCLMIAKKGSYLGKLVFPFIALRPPDVAPLFGHLDPHLFTFELPYYDQINVRRGSIWISEKNQLAIQAIVEAHFRFHFRTFADDKVRYMREQHTAKGSIQKVIRQFCSDVNIRYDDTTFDMISKAYYRARKKSALHNISGSKRMMIGHLFFII